MQVALTIWEGRISPLFDATRTLLIAGIEGGRVVSRRLERLEGDTPVARAGRLRELGTELLICGGISHPYANLIQACGIRVLPFAAGDVEEVLEAFLQGRLDQTRYRMPGCGGFQAGGPRTRRQHRRRKKDEDRRQCQRPQSRP